jgi:hypothetical protein
MAFNARFQLGEHAQYSPVVHITHQYLLQFLIKIALFLAYFPYFEKEVLGRTNRLLSFDTTRTA